MSDDEVIERYMRRFDRAVGAEPAALNELLESFSDDAVVNFDGTPYAGRARLLELYGRVLEPLVEACTHFAPERLPDGTMEGAVGSIRPDVRWHRHRHRRHRVLHDQWPSPDHQPGQRAVRAPSHPGGRRSPRVDR